MSEEAVGRALGEAFKRRLGIDDEQEALVDHALGDVREAFKELHSDLQENRSTLAEVFRAESIDDSAVAAAFARQDDALGRTRRAVLSAGKQIHAVLDAEQRGELADWIAQGQLRWGR